MDSRKVSHPPEKPHGISGRSRYVYEPLKDGQSARFLVLQPGSGSDPLIGRLQVESLDSADIKQLPLYEAISYVWGNGDRQFKFICDGDILPLTHSIYNALHRVRLPNEPRRLWADQVCINQDDIQERSQQVKLMNLIYKNAKGILVWLGKDSAGVAKNAAQMVRYLDKVFKDEKAHVEFKFTYEEKLAIQSSEPWVPLAKLTKLPWFQRVWIVQEIGTTAPATLYWGDTEMDWKALSFVASTLIEKYYHFRTRFSINTSIISYLHRRFVEPGTTYLDSNKGHFAYELHKARPLLARDHRDRIYAFLGHYSFSKGGKELQNLTVDYSKTLKDVYIDAAVRILRGAEDLVLLSSAHRDKLREDNNNDLGLPSWVPDWRYQPLHILGTPSVPHRASKDTKPDLTIDENTRILHIRGVRVDVLAKTSWKIDRKAFHIRQDAQETKEVEREWENLVRQEELDEARAYKRTPDNKKDHNDRAQQQGRPSHEQRKADQNGPRTHAMESLWKSICGYRSFDLTDVYCPFQENPPTVTAACSTPILSLSSSSLSSPTSPASLHDHRRSAFFAFIQTLTNACVGFDRSRLYSTIPSEEFLSSGAAYLVRYAQPPPFPASLPATTTSSSIIQSESEKLPSLPSKSQDKVSLSPAIQDLSHNGDPFKWSHEAVLVTRYRRFAITRKGYFVLGPEALQENDVVVVLRGGKVPFLLRRVSAMGNDPEGGWVLVGECYVHGLMDGEKWDVEGVEEEVFTIQ